MPTTSNFGWTTPADTDLVKDGAAAIRTLGNGVDASFIDLKGGTTGQILSKASNTDLDFTWTAGGDITEVQAGVGISVASGTGPIPVITNSSTDLITTAGDLLYGTAADTVARLGIGTAGQVLKVNSGATAPEWGASGSTFAGCYVYNSTNPSISNNSYTLITFDTELYDTDGYHDNVTNNSRITIPSGKAGYYLIVGKVGFDNATNTTGARAANLIINGNGISYDFSAPASGSAGDVQTSFQTVIRYLAVGDYVQMNAYQNSGGSRTLNQTVDNTYLSVAYLGA